MTSSAVPSLHPGRRRAARPGPRLAYPRAGDQPGHRRATGSGPRCTRPGRSERLGVLGRLDPPVVVTLALGAPGSPARPRRGHLVAAGVGRRDLAAPGGPAAPRDARSSGPRWRSWWCSPPRSSTRSRRCSRCTSTGWATCRRSSHRVTVWSTSAPWRSAGRPGCTVVPARPWRPPSCSVACTPGGGCSGRPVRTHSARSGTSACSASCAWGRSRTLYVGAFFVVTYLELLGTWWGTWAWSTHDPTGLVVDRQPALGCRRRLRLVRPGRRPRRPRRPRRRHPPPRTAARPPGRRPRKAPARTRQHPCSRAVVSPCVLRRPFLGRHRPQGGHGE